MLTHLSMHGLVASPSNLRLTSLIILLLLLPITDKPCLTFSVALPVMKLQYESSIFALHEARLAHQDAVQFCTRNGGQLWKVCIGYSPQPW